MALSLKRTQPGVAGLDGVKAGRLNQIAGTSEGFGSVTCWSIVCNGRDMRVIRGRETSTVIPDRLTRRKAGRPLGGLVLNDLHRGDPGGRRPDPQPLDEGLHLC